MCRVTRKPSTTECRMTTHSRDAVKGSSHFTTSRLSREMVTLDLFDVCQLLQRAGALLKMRDDDASSPGTLAGIGARQNGL